MNNLKWHLEKAALLVHPCRKATGWIELIVDSFHFVFTRLKSDLSFLSSFPYQFSLRIPTLDGGSIKEVVLSYTSPAHPPPSPPQGCSWIQPRHPNICGLYFRNGGGQGHYIVEGGATLTFRERWHLRTWRYHGWGALSAPRLTEALPSPSPASVLCHQRLHRNRSLHHGRLVPPFTRRRREPSARLSYARRRHQSRKRLAGRNDNLHARQRGLSPACRRLGRQGPGFHDWLDLLKQVQGAYGVLGESQLKDRDDKMKRILNMTMQ